MKKVLFNQPVGDGFVLTITLTRNECGQKQKRSRVPGLQSYIKRYAASRNKEGQQLCQGRSGSILSVRKHLMEFMDKDIPINRVDKDFCEEFINYLHTAPNLKHPGKRLSVNTIYLKFSIFRSVLNEAVREGFLVSNPIQQLPSSVIPSKEDPGRPFLTTAELRRLIKTPCSNQELKRAFLFSCFTGLRVSDVLETKWNNLYVQQDKVFLSKIVHKTKRRITIPLCRQARCCLFDNNFENNVDFKTIPSTTVVGTAIRKFSDQNIFKSMAESTISYHLDKWAKDAHITDKKVTFHMARHTFATLELSLGADIYTVSNLLGHSNVTTTQLYAKVVDKQREKAVSLLDKF